MAFTQLAAAALALSFCLRRRQPLSGDEGDSVAWLQWSPLRCVKVSHACGRTLSRDDAAECGPPIVEAGVACMSHGFVLTRRHYRTHFLGKKVGLGKDMLGLKRH